jgi:hypothetical protein
MWTLLAAFVAFLILAGLALIQVAISRSESDNVLFKVSLYKKKSKKSVFSFVMMMTILF